MSLCLSCMLAYLILILPGIRDFIINAHTTYVCFTTENWIRLADPQALGRRALGVVHGSTDLACI